MANKKEATRSQTETKYGKKWAWMCVFVFVKQCVWVCVFLTVSSSDWLSPFRLLCRKALELPPLEILIRDSRAFCQHIHTQRKLQLSPPVLFHHKRFDWNKEFQSDPCWKSHSDQSTLRNKIDFHIDCCPSWDDEKCKWLQKTTEPIPDSHAVKMCTDQGRRKRLLARSTKHKRMVI